MDNTSHEATGSRRAPPQPLPLSPTQQVRSKIDDGRLCIRHALDYLDLDDMGRGTWVDVAAQLTAAGVFIAQAAELATVEADAIDAVPEEQSAANPPSSVDTYLPLPSNGLYERGA